MKPESDPQVFAAIDLGSNSFHMVVAKYVDGRVQIIDRIKEMVRLADGLDEDRNLSDEAMERTIACLERFSQRISEIPAANIRAVGTNALRQARNSSEFLNRARRALGHRIQIIAGREEARLIYLGVTHTVYKENEQRLVADIGGGSTELIIGKDFKPMLTESLYMGCVGMTRAHFQDGKITAKKMRNATLHAHQELETIVTQYKRKGWDSAIGSSGTVLAIERVLSLQKWGQGGITPEGLQTLQQALIDAGHCDDLRFEGLSDKRRSVFAGGVAILSAIFESLQIDHMTVSEGALREGLLFELIGRTQQQDVRDETISELQTRYGIDTEHAKRVQHTAVTLLEKLNTESDDPATIAGDRQLLGWAASLHEIGLAIAHTQFHKHGAYLVRNSDLPGFSRQEQYDLAILIRNHRRKLNLDDFSTADNGNDRLLRLCVLLRLAGLMNRSRSSTPLPAMEIYAEATSLEICFPDGWLAEHPLTGVDLETEAVYLASAGYTLTYS